MYYDEYSACNYCLKESTGVKVRRNKTLQNTITNTMIGCMLTKTIILKYIYIIFQCQEGIFGRSLNVENGKLIVFINLLLVY